MGLIRKLRNRLFQNLEFCIHDATLGANLASCGCRIDTVNICKNDPILPLKTRIAKSSLIHFQSIIHEWFCYRNKPVSPKNDFSLYNIYVIWSDAILQHFKVKTLANTQQIRQDFDISQIYFYSTCRRDFEQLMLSISFIWLSRKQR